MRARLLEAAAALLAEQGPNALSTRRIAAAAETSTMAVYTQFGSIDALVRAVVDEGFQRLADAFAACPNSLDPVADIARIGLAYVANARRNPNLYQVMFSTASLGRFRPVTPQELQTGRRDTFDVVTAACTRAVAAERFRPADGVVLSTQWWIVLHGYCMLELAHYIGAHAGVPKILSPMLSNLFVGLGDEPGRAASSIVAAGLSTPVST
ncbi:TetR/AcrR family transcriptional regulator [Skermania piniformis]|nr:TetR/AcrR family transcriptional regulator [Skermania piniformis]